MTIIDKIDQRPAISLEHLDDLSVRDVRLSAKILEPLQDKERHSQVLWGLIDKLNTASEEQIPRLIGQIDLLNVEHPDWIGRPHSLQVASQLRSLFTDEKFGKWYAEYPQEVYEAIITDLESGGGLARYVDAAEKVRASQGIATPIPLTGVMERIKRQKGKGDNEWNPEIVSEISSFLGATPLEEIDRIYPTNYVFTTTGFGRNRTFEAVRPFIKPDGTYVEIGSSLGIYAVDVKQALGFRKLIASDIMSEEQAREITSVTDFQKGGSVPYADDHRARIEKGIDQRLWRHNILRDRILPHVSDRTGFFCFGFPNVLVHLIDKDKAVQNATEGLLKPDDLIWVSGGYCANTSVFPNLLYRRTPRGIDTFLIDNSHTKPLNSLEQVKDARINK